VLRAADGNHFLFIRGLLGRFEFFDAPGFLTPPVIPPSTLKG
jgi:hypothetical protein